MTAPSADQLLNPDGEVKRDRWGRPLIRTESGKEVGFTRATTFAGALDDKQNLIDWTARMAMVGMVQRSDLQLAVLPYVQDPKANRKDLNGLVKQALEAARAHEAATIGTAIHALTEKADRGEDLGPVPAAYVRDIEAYREATKNLTVLAIEKFVVIDELEVGGTADRIVMHDGQLFIADIKSGSLDFATQKIAMQLALYSRGKAYDFKTQQRTPIPPVSQDRAIVIHLPAGEGKCTLYWIDIAAGWEAIQLAKDVRDWRKRRDLLKPMGV